VRAGEEIYEFFTTNVGQPNRVYVWRDSLGGLITQTLAEKHPEWVDGAAPLCGVVAGLVPNIGLALDAAYGVQQLLVPDLQVVDYADYADALSAWETAYRTNAQSRAMEESLVRWGIPYIVVGGLRFYDRREIKDVLACLRLLDALEDLEDGRSVTSNLEADEELLAEVMG